MLSSQMSILRSSPAFQHLKRSMTGMRDKKNPFVKEKLPALPAMETISTRDRDLEQLCQTHLSSQKAKHGVYDFFECKEGYILCYINAYQPRKEPKNVFYGVYYGANHPLNTQGPVKGIQTLPHGKDNAILNAIRMFPKIEAKKLCICTDYTPTIKMMRRLPEYAENGYRRATDGRVLERKDTYEQLAKEIRLRDDLRIRFLYTPADVIFQLREPLKLASTASRSEIE